MVERRFKAPCRGMQRAERIQDKADLITFCCVLCYARVRCATVSDSAVASARCFKLRKNAQSKHRVDSIHYTVR